jgi:hypothetical protein
MHDPKLPTSYVLGLRAGEWAEVRSADEILATLDDQGRLEALPFMPEMLQHCGKRFRVFKSAHKTCDTIEKYKGRSMTNAVHLEGLRCDGGAHGGCQAGCLLFWKDAWLKRVDGATGQNELVEVGSEARHDISRLKSHCDLEALTKATKRPAGEGAVSEERFCCQATELLKATMPLQWWDPRQYIKDIASRNVRLRDFVRYVMIAAYNVVMRLHWRGRPYPYIRGIAGEKTPATELNLQPGELIQVRSKDEISRTINANHRNRGLSFDVEMVRYCGGTFRVLRRVEKIIDEKSGKMIYPPGACLILDGVTCSGCLSTNRLFCPRSIYPYWHEIWLKRVE